MTVSCDIRGRELFRSRESTEITRSVCKENREKWFTATIVCEGPRNTSSILNILNLLCRALLRLLDDELIILECLVWNAVGSGTER